MSNETLDKDFFCCPVCRFRISLININGLCPNCDSEGFNTLRLHYGKCHDCSFHFFNNDFLKCNFGHRHVPKYFCKDYKQQKLEV
ncbi:hypothetical protein ES702_02981 [subsurface metagenome]